MMNSAIDVGLKVIRLCRTAKHLVDLYQASKQKARPVIETNLATHDDTFDGIINEDITHLETDDFI